MIFSTNEVSFSQSFDLFPNPTKDEVTLEFSEPISENLRFQLFNTLGQEVQAGVLAAQRNEIKLGGLLPGVYWMQVMTESGQQIGQPLMIH